jgi:hypothetical protein
MNAIDRDSPERLPDETARAYQAFSVYRDLGPSRSHDLAWKRLGDEQGKDRSSPRRSGHWAQWSTKFNWVARAETHDQLINEARRTADVERRQQLQETRSRFAAGEQERKQKLVLAMDLALHKMLTASATEITQVKSDREAGTKITTRVRPPNLRGVAALADVANKTAGLRSRVLMSRISDKKKEKLSGFSG